MRPTQRPIWLQNVYINALKKKAYCAPRDRSFIISTKEVISYLLKQCLIHSKEAEMRQCMTERRRRQEIRDPSRSQRVCFPAANTETTSRCLASRSSGLEETPYMHGKMPTDTPLQCMHTQSDICLHTHTHNTSCVSKSTNRQTDD